MIKDDLTHWLTLLHLPTIGATAKLALVNHFGDAGSVFSASAAELRSILGDHFKPGTLRPSTVTRSPTPSAQLARDLSWLERPGHYLLTFPDPAYPELLRATPDPPLALFVCGDIAALCQPQIAIVGSRNPSPGGRDNARGFAHGLARLGFAITSGMALGIDAEAHQGALDASGVTIAVAACGLDIVYPRRHTHLATRIVTNGAMISEFCIGTPPLRSHFPRRNRLISGLSSGTLVVEATPKSGSLITARLAANQGREVFAVPGSIHSPLARGCHALIREGATLVEDIQDILDELGPWATPQRVPQDHTQPPVSQDVCSAPLLDYIGYEPITVDRLVERSQLTADVVCSMLLEMELQGLIVPWSGGTYIRVRRGAVL